MAKKIIASAVRNVKHIADFDTLIKERMDGIDVSAVLIYMVDIVKEPALYYLAEQFDVLGYKGWALAQNEAERRDLIKRAIDLHRTKGTPYAIKRAISAAVAGIDYGDITIVEHINNGGFFHDGTIFRNGAYVFGYSHWATFRVVIDLTGYGPMTADASFLILQMILEYKNVRSWLVDLSYGLPFEETFETDEEFLINTGEDFPEDLMFSFFHDGENLRDGSRQHQNDIFEIDIQNLLPYSLLEDGGEDLLENGDNLELG